MKWLFIIEFYRKNSTLDTTHTRFFVANYGFYPKIKFEPQPFSINIEVRLLKEFIKYIKVLKGNLKAKMLLA